MGPGWTKLLYLFKVKTISYRRKTVRLRYWVVLLIQRSLQHKKWRPSMASKAWLVKAKNIASLKLLDRRRGLRSIGYFTKSYLCLLVFNFIINAAMNFVVFYDENFQKLLCAFKLCYPTPFFHQIPLIYREWWQWEMNCSSFTLSWWIWLNC